MNIFDKLLGKSKPSPESIPHGYFQVPVIPTSSGVCSDDKCPCPNTQIPRGTGYLYISAEVVKNRFNARSHEEVERLAEKWQREMARRLGTRGYSNIGAVKEMFFPILMCDQGAKLRGINLDVAAADAKHWWETGLVPLRPTPPG